MLYTSSLRHFLNKMTKVAYYLLFLQTPIKKLSGRLNAIGTSDLPAQSLNISAADGDLASKLARLAGEADTIKQKMSDGKITASNR